MGVFGDPDNVAILAVNLCLEVVYLSMRLHQCDIFGALSRMNVKLLLDIADATHQLSCRVVAIDPGQRRIYVGILPGGAGLVDTFDGIFKNGTVALLCCFRQLFALLTESNILNETLQRL